MAAAQPSSRDVRALGDDEFPAEARISLGLACPRINRRRPVLVQREVERGRSPLASITPFSASRFGTTSPQRSGGWRNGWRLKLVSKKGKHVGWSALTQVHIIAKGDKLTDLVNGQPVFPYWGEGIKS